MFVPQHQLLKRKKILLLLCFANGSNKHLNKYSCVEFGLEPHFSGEIQVVIPRATLWG